jgi:1-acyl-sn-glycerol-3-phosphate acyltransferase
MAFPEGQRSRDGRLMEFKGGIFSMATKANVPIVPISLCHTHAVMPANSLFPVQPGRGKLHIHVHKPIRPEGLSEAELAILVRTALLSEMPEIQQPILTSID